MKVSILRKISIAIATLLASSTVFAGMDMDSRVTQLENQMQQVRTETAIGTYGAQTATTRPEVDGYGWNFTVNALYWHAKVGGTEFAYTDQDPLGNLPISGRAKDIDFSWDWGLRFGLGYNLDYDGWDIRAMYTWFDSNDHSSTGAGQNSSVVPLKGSSKIVDDVNRFQFCNSAKSQFDFDYQTIILELGRAYFVSSQISFRPHWGLKTAWIDQKQKTTYSGGEAEGETLGLGVNNVKVKEESDFWGLGPRAGVNSKWHLGKSFSIFGNIAAAVLYGKFDVDHRERFSAVEDRRIKLSANRHAFSPNLQMQLGLRYDGYFKNNKHHLGIGLGYEAQYWWRQNQILKINDDRNVIKYDRYSEDVNIYGLTLDVTWDF